MDTRWMLMARPAGEYLLEGTVWSPADTGGQEHASDPLAARQCWPICEGHAGEDAGYPWERVPAATPAADPLSVLLARARRMLRPASSVR